MKIYKKEIIICKLEGWYDGYIVEAHNSATETEFYLYHKQYGVKMQMLRFAPRIDESEIELLIDEYIEECVERYINDFITEEIA
jgi:hypothetical protein